MKIKSSMYFFLMSCALVCGSQQAFSAATEFSHLSHQDQEKVKNGTQVYLFTDVAGEAWPEANIYQYVNVTPEEATAVFSDFNLQSTYIPYMTKSVSKKQGKALYEIDYTVAPQFGGMKLKPENYTVRDTIAYDKSSGRYEINWKLVRADTTKISVGYARFEPMGSGTLFSYYSFVESNQWGVSLPFVVTGVKDTLKLAVTKIVERLQTVKNQHNDLLQNELAELRKDVE